MSCHTHKPFCTVQESIDDAQDVLQALHEADVEVSDIAAHVAAAEGDVASAQSVVDELMTAITSHKDGYLEANQRCKSAEAAIVRESSRVGRLAEKLEEAMQQVPHGVGTMVSCRPHFLSFYPSQPLMYPHSTPLFLPSHPLMYPHSTPLFLPLTPSHVPSLHSTLSSPHSLPPSLSSRCLCSIMPPYTPSARSRRMTFWS